MMAEEDQNWNDFLAQFPHGLIVLKDDTIVHAVGYPRACSKMDVDHLVRELAEDGEFGLTDLRDYSITPLSGDDWRKYLMIFVGEE